MRQIIKCSVDDYTTLAGIWERSVRATHFFLDENAINDIKEALIPKYFPEVDMYAVSDNDTLVGFIGMSGDMIEMLFIDSDSRGMGYGSALIDYATDKGATKVDVNEQNHSALAFYKAKGFKITGRDETDAAGLPYPILHLSL